MDVLRGSAHRQRHSGHPPRRGARVQGRLPALQDHAGAARRAEGRLGLPRAAGRDRRREGARLQRQARHRGLRHRRVQRPVPRGGPAQRRPVRGDDRPHGLLGRHVRPVPDDGLRVRRERLVGADADLRQGPAGRGLPRRSVLPALRHHAVRPRARAGLRDHHRPVDLRPVPAHVRARTPAQASLLVWTTTPWTLVSNALVAAKGDVTYVTATNGTETLIVAEPLVEHALGDGWTVQDTFTGADMVGWTYQRPFEIIEWPERVERRQQSHGPISSSPRTTSPPPTAPAWCTSPPRSARTTSRRCAATASRWSTRSTRPATSRRASASSAALFFRDANDALLTDLTAPRPAVPPGAVRALLPALLAVPHAAAVLRPAGLVHPHHRHQGRAAGRRTRPPTGTRTRSSTAATATG